MDIIIELSTLMMIMFVFLYSENSFQFASGAADEDVIMCKDNEREALLTLKQGLAPMDSFGDLSSWGDEMDKRECCKWLGVKCSITTNHVTGLNLYNLRGEISPALVELSHLNSLVLQENDFGGNRIPEFIGSLKKLDHLSVSENNFSGHVPYQMGNLTSLTELDLSRNHLASKDLTWLSNLSLLSTLDLSFNQFEGPFPRLKAFSSLREIHLQGNKLTDQLPTSISHFTSLEILDVSHNSLEGTISEIHLAKLDKLKTLDFSFNSLALNFTPDWTPPFRLDSILLACCNMGPHFPAWLQTQHNFSYLDLSSAGISEKVPEWFWDLSQHLVYLNLSSNRISGLILDLSSNFDLMIDLNDLVTPPIIDISSNNFSGPLPKFHPNSSIILLSKNQFRGSIQSICMVKYDALQILDLSKNQFSGELPNCWENMTSLLIVNLADNNFSGHLPQNLGALMNLKTLRFRNNDLTGELPSTLKNCTNLQLIDGGGNELTGNIPVWMGTLTELKTLSLQKNNFRGSIPSEICRLKWIRVLDFSGNNISGRIPRCFSNFTFMIVNMEWTESEELGPYVDNNVVVQWKRQELEYKNKLGLLNLVDLSSNKIAGNIPGEVFHLARLVSLNLSQNVLSGSISSNIDDMKMLESLDLSRNRLSGKIPFGLAKLNYLNVLDLSSNSLSGEIPKGTQLQSFDASSYAGNIELCGEPLPKCAQDTPSSVNHGNEGGSDDQSDKGVSVFQSLMDECLISAASGYIAGLCFAIGLLRFKPSWRNACYSNKIEDWLSVKITANNTRLGRSGTGRARTNARC